MKKVVSITLALWMLVSILCLCVFAEAAAPASADVYVTIAKKGTLVLTQEKVTVTDIDNDNALTINDALYCAHEASYNGGAAAGYSSYASEYGVSIGTLWGDNSGSFGYKVNNESAWSLADPVKAGDHVYAFIYTDTETWSDVYCFFDVNTASVDQGGEVSLTVSYASYDENWAPITLPLANATITVNGAATTAKTDAEGKVTVKLDKAGDVIISATSETQTLVPPVCKVTVAQKTSVPTGVIVICIAVALVAGIVVGRCHRCGKGKKADEK